MATATQKLEGVVIDGAIPRTPYERCVVLFDYLISISEVGPHSDSDPHTIRTKVDAEYDWVDLEEELIRKINEKLPLWLICAVGEVDPGDVIVRPWDAD